MKPFRQKTVLLLAAGLLLTSLACSLAQRVIDLPAQATNPPLTETPLPPPSQIPTEASAPTETANPSATPAPTEAIPTTTSVVSHSLVPPAAVDTGELIHDVVCVDTAAEQRAPYGDRYESNLLERPFLEDMTYVPDLDIKTFSLSKDEKFYYVSIALVGANPNNELGILYGVQLDFDADGFGNLMVVARPPYNVAWSTDNVQVVEDLDHDTGGLSSALADGPLSGTGYETVTFDGGRGPDDKDPDLAWVRVNAGKNATVQFAFKLGLAGTRFMFGVSADAGLKDITDLDYVDRFTEVQAGSPIRGDKNYPLKALFGVDNTCRKIQGFKSTGVEPQSCPEK